MRPTTSASVLASTRRRAADPHAALRRQLGALLTWADAHVTFDAAVKGVPPKQRGIRPPGLPYSLWEIVEHIRLTGRDILEFCVDPAYRERTWPDEYWPGSPAPPTARAWQESVAAVRADRRELAQLVGDPATDLFAPIPHGTGQTILREALLVADHTAFHVGQLVVLRRLLGVWA